MIEWMQKHKKWLIITIWISTIAFIGAGFVGWGAYSYGDKASAVAKVGKVDITLSEFQKAYSDLYAQYAKIFQGNFDKEKAKAFGIEKQALQKLINQALILNLAKEYEITVSDKELAKTIASMPYFQKNGKFDKQLYKEILMRNNLNVKEFEESVRKQLTIDKTLALLPVKTIKQENTVADTAFNIADKLKYKVLSTEDIKVKVDEKELKEFWQQHKENFKTDVAYVIAYVVQPKVSKNYDEATMRTYYNDNKTHFRDNEGKILPFEKAKEKIKKELDAKATKKSALKTYIAFKNGKIQNTQELTLSNSNNPLNKEVLQKVSQLTPQTPYLKPVPYKEGYIIVKLLSVVPSKTKSFQEAKSELIPLYIAQKKQALLLQKAKSMLPHFTGEVSDFVTVREPQKLKTLSEKEAKLFLGKLFAQQKKTDFIVINRKKIVLFDILEQKLLKNSYEDSAKIVSNIKQTLFDENLIKKLRSRYNIEIYYKGL